MTPKIITIRYIKRYKTLATLKFSTAAYRVVVSTDHIRLNTWPSNYLFTPKYKTEDDASACHYQQKFQSHAGDLSQ